MKGAESDDKNNGNIYLTDKIARVGSRRRVILSYIFFWFGRDVIYYNTVITEVPMLLAIVCYNY